MKLTEIKNRIKIKPFYETQNGILYNADCVDVMKDIQDNAIDMIITDPPYGIEFKSNRQKHQRSIINDDHLSCGMFMPIWFREFKRVMKDNACCLYFTTGGNNPLVMANTIIEASKHLNVIQNLIWHKSMGLGWKYRSAYECILLMSKDRKKYKFYDISRKLTNVISGINQVIPRAGDHPTTKPLLLLEKLLLIHSGSNDIVLDPFCGAGSTLIACENNMRQWIGIEIDKEYCEIAKRKIKEVKWEKYIWD